ncbi:large-conductance mechanosensitive channel protein MscL [Synergistaceae bacterium OttesenSCG-928-I11]|nr:large-conductance mechanosensitive channel protein MscL [Synergistaceae bacterium OttesenSCG-928-I11]
MSFMQDFKTFAMRGNVMDMAVGVIIGASFGKIVSSFVNDVLMPPIGLLLGKVDFSNLFLNLGHTEVATLAEAQAKGVPVLSYGVFINTVIDFLIQALVIFTIIRQMNRLMPAPAPAPALPTKDCPYCFTSIDERATRCPNCTAELK